MHKPSLYRQTKICLFSAVPTRFFLGVTRKIENVVGLLYSIMFKFLGHMREYIKCKVRGFPSGVRIRKGCSCMTLNYLFSTENEDFLCFHQCAYFVIISEFLIPIHNDRIMIMDNETIRIRFYSFYFGLRPFSFVLEAF